MGFRFDINLRDRISADINAILDGLSDRTALHQRMAGPLEALTANHLFKISDYRHKTAQRLGATPTGFLSQAAESVSAGGDSSGVTLNIGSPGLRNAFGDVEIKPTDSKYLTLPLKAEAYGKRAREFGDGFFKLIPNRKTGNLFLVPNQKGMGPKDAFYLLRESVTLPQDRDLLPSDAEYGNEAEAVGIEYIDELLASPNS